MTVGVFGDLRLRTHRPDYRTLLAALSVALTLSAAHTSVASAQSTTVFVDARANIFGYGSTTPAPGGGGGGLVAPVVALQPGTGRSFGVSSTSGQVDFNGLTFLPNGADGQDFSRRVTIPSVGPVSGVSAPGWGWLVAMFIESGDLSALPAPSALDYPDLDSLNLLSYSPSLRQVFVVGDGRTATNAAQTFNIPDNATALVFGFADFATLTGPAGLYNDNTGGITVTIVPSPSALFFAFAGGLFAVRRSRRFR